MGILWPRWYPKDVKLAMDGLVCLPSIKKNRERDMCLKNMYQGKTCPRLDRKIW